MIQVYLHGQLPVDPLSHFAHDYDRSCSDSEIYDVVIQRRCVFASNSSFQGRCSNIDEPLLPYKVLSRRRKHGFEVECLQGCSSSRRFDLQSQQLFLFLFHRIFQFLLLPIHKPSTLFWNQFCMSSIVDMGAFSPTLFQLFQSPGSRFLFLSIAASQRWKERGYLVEHVTLLLFHCSDQKETIQAIRFCFYPFPIYSMPRHLIMRMFKK